MNNKKEKNFFILLPDSLIKVLRVKMVEDGLLDTPLPVGKLMFVGAIVGLSKEKGYCYAKNTNKAKKSGLTELTTLPIKSIEKYIHSLEEDEILYRYYYDGERRIKVHNKLIERYPEITKDIFQNPHNEGDNPHNEGDNPHNEGDNPHNEGDNPHFALFTYYIYKIKEIITKNKENKNKDFWLVDLDDKDFKKWIEKNPLTYEQSKKQAFDAISAIYPVQAKTKEARGEFEKLNEIELKELFESMQMFLDHVENQKEKNLSAREPMYKYIEKFVNYIGKKSFKNYQKNFQEGRQFGLEEFEAFLERVEEYAYEMTEEGDFLPSPIDEYLDYRQLKIIVYNYKKGKTIEELRPYCRALTGFKEESA